MMTSASWTGRIELKLETPDFENDATLEVDELKSFNSIEPSSSTSNQVRSPRETAYQKFAAREKATTRSPREKSFIPKSPFLSKTAREGNRNQDRNCFLSLKFDLNASVRHDFGYCSLRNHEILVSSKAKKNQDSIMAGTINIDGREVNVFAVLDGHGAMGDKASQFAARKLLERLKANMKDGMQDPAAMIRTCFLEVETGLVTKYPLHVQQSGTTCVLLVQIGAKVYCGNVGDSRCILGRYASTFDTNEDENLVSDGKYVNINLSSDHVPSDPAEQERITSAGGVVDRVCWVRDPFQRRRATLAMTRSLGDLWFKQIGVICEPEIRGPIELDIMHSYVLLASDGVWQVLSEEEVLEIIESNSGDSGQRIAELIVSKAEHAWHYNEDGTDDISVIFSWLMVDDDLEQSEAKENLVSSLTNSFLRRRGSRQPSGESFGQKVLSMGKSRHELRSFFKQ